MKTTLKLTLASVFTSIVATTGALADDIKITQFPNNHGSSIMIYRQRDDAQQPSVGVYANGAGVGQYAQAGANQSPRLCFRDNGHGVQQPQYVAQ